MITILLACSGDISIIEQPNDDTAEEVEDTSPTYRLSIEHEDGTDCTVAPCGVDAMKLRVSLHVTGPVSITTDTACYADEWGLKDHGDGELIMSFACEPEETQWDIGEEEQEVHFMFLEWTQQNIDDGVMHPGNFQLCVSIDTFVTCQLFSL